MLLTFDAPKARSQRDVEQQTFPALSKRYCFFLLTIVFSLIKAHTQGEREQCSAPVF